MPHRASFSKFVRHRLKMAELLRRPASSLYPPRMSFEKMRNFPHTLLFLGTSSVSYLKENQDFGVLWWHKFPEVTVRCLKNGTARKFLPAGIRSAVPSRRSIVIQWKENKSGRSRKSENVGGPREWWMAGVKKELRADVKLQWYGKDGKNVNTVRNKANNGKSSLKTTSRGCLCGNKCKSRDAKSPPGLSFTWKRIFGNWTRIQALTGGPRWPGTFCQQTVGG